MKLKNKTAIIVGGSGGIGRVVSEFFCCEGARVGILGIDREEIARAISEIERATGFKPVAFFADITDYRSVARAVRAAVKKFRRIDILINAAGIQAPLGPFVSQSPEAWEKNIAVNLFGVANVCRAMLPFMIKAKSGSIINFSGGGATSSRPNFTAYAVAKTGVVKLTEVLADELKPYHIKINAISPGGVNTGMTEEVFKLGAARVGKKEFKETKQRLRGGGTPPEFAAALCVFLASKDSGGLTGRLISAVWDDWRQWRPSDIAAIVKSDKFHLRRS